MVMTSARRCVTAHLNASWFDSRVGMTRNSLASRPGPDHRLTMNCFRSFAIFLLALGAAFPVAVLAADAPLIGHEPIEIPNSRGGFDFLEVDAARDRLLLDHVGNGTLD